jgi:regulator of sigma E protease
LGILIFFHELGHFLIAKHFGVKVLKFSLGFGYKLVGKRIGETEYLISSIPLGGYVKMLGESDDDAEDIAPEEEERAFHKQPPFRRLAIVAAGPLFNLALALLLFCGLYVLAGLQVMTPEVGQVRAGSPAARAGLMKGDIILAVEDKPVESWEALKAEVKDHVGESLVMTVQRAERVLTLTVVPEESVVKNIFGEEVKSALIGIVSAGKYRQLTLSPLRAVGEGFRKTGEVIYLTCLTVVKIFQRVIPIKTIGGPILIGQMTGEIAKESFLYLIPFMAVISINLGILNLLPVPILDGGMILFLIIEALRGKPISIKKRDLAQKVGLFFLIFLMVVVFYNDISRFFE